MLDNAKSSKKVNNCSLIGLLVIPRYYPYGKVSYDLTWSHVILTWSHITSYDSHLISHKWYDSQVRCYILITFSYDFSGEIFRSHINLMRSEFLIPFSSEMYDSHINPCEIFYSHVIKMRIFFSSNSHLTDMILISRIGLKFENIDVVCLFNHWIIDWFDSSSCMIKALICL